MKKTLVVLMLVALAVPAMADVAITGVDEGDQKLAIYADSAAVMRGVALKLTITGGNLASTAEYLASDFNTFVDYAFTNAGYVFDAVGNHPLADPTKAGVLATFPATDASVSVGYLDNAGFQAGLTGKKLVARLHISGIANGATASIAIVADTLRGGAVVGDTVGAVTIQSPVTVAGPFIVVPVCTDKLSAAEKTDYAAYVAAGKDPSCWCWMYQCRGDADNKTETLSKYRVYNGDLNLVTANWKLKIDAANPCADFDHKSETLSKYRVYNADLNLLVANWKAKDAALVICPTYLVP